MIIGTESPAPETYPDLWIGARFGEPTGPAGEPWPDPAGASAPAESAARFAPCRVRPEQCDDFWLSFFLPEWRLVDQDSDPILIRLALPWAEAMTITEIVEKAALAAPIDAKWIVSWRFARWWPPASDNLHNRPIYDRAQEFLRLLSHRVAAATGHSTALVTNTVPLPGKEMTGWDLL